MSSVKDRPLGQLGRGELEFLRRAIQRRQLPTPITEIALQSVGKGRLYARLGPLASAPREAALALVELALAAGEGAGERAGPEATLVWTGPEVRGSRARPTTPVLLELFGAARRRVIVAGYEIDHGAVLFAPLHRAMVERGVAVDMYLQIRPVPGPRASVDAHLALEAHRFLERNWPFGAPLPALHYFPAGVAHGSQKSLHAKCVVVDGERVLVGSANFTRRAHGRNIEVGVCLRDAALAAALTGQLDRLVDQGDLARLPAAAPAHALPPEVMEDEEDGDAGAVGGLPGGTTGGAIAVSAGGVSDSEQLADELYVSDEARALFGQLLAAGLAPPRVGEDVEGERGEVAGSPELSWPGPRVAVLLPEQESCRKKLEAAGWTCFSVTLGAEELDALCELVGLEGAG